jgi:predicted SprT family Zn-dependent metalloprotease
LQFLRQKQGKNTSLQKNTRRKERSELELLRAYRTKLSELGIEQSQIEKFDLDNDFYWLFRLTDLISLAYRIFDDLNRKFFENQLERPKIIFCARSTGGYYNKGRHTIGISLPMTIEFGEPEFFETLLHEIAHIVVSSHSPKFYKVLHAIGGSGKKAPLTLLLQAKRKLHAEKHYPIVVHCPNCLRQSRYKTRRALRYACRICCNKYAGGKYDERFKLKTV